MMFCFQESICVIVVSQLEMELSEAKDMLIMQEETSKQTLLDLQTEHRTKIEQVSFKYSRSSEAMIPQLKLRFSF